MKISKILGVAVIALAVTSCNNNSISSKAKLENEIDSVSYAFGVNMSKQFKLNFKEIDREVFTQGLVNGLDSTNLLINDKEALTVLQTFFQKKQQEKIKEQRAKALKQAEVKFKDVKEAGEKFLAENKSKKGVKTTASGLQYKVLKEGAGDLVKPTDRIKIHYHGTTVDGKVFDSTIKRNTPYESRANQFIKGFNEGLALMKVGSKYKFFIPQEIAYGPQQRGELIKPLSALVFEVEVLEIKKQ